MDTKALFGEVDFAVQEALDNRKSVLDTIDLEEWTDDVLKRDAQEVNDLIEKTLQEKGWTLKDYNHIVYRFTPNRHTPKSIKI